MYAAAAREQNLCRVDQREQPIRQVLHTPVRVHFMAQELEWADNVLPICETGINGNHQMVINFPAQARIYFENGLNSADHNNRNAEFLMEALHQKQFTVCSWMRHEGW